MSTPGHVNLTLENEKVKASQIVIGKGAPTPEGFVTSWPLYSVAEIRQFHPPSSISFDCDGACGKETTWQRTCGPQDLVVSANTNPVSYVGYACAKCQSNSLLVFYVRMKSAAESLVMALNSPDGIAGSVIDRTPYSQVVKIGQYPSISASIPKGLEKNLGKDAAVLYRKGIISRNNGYGLGALVYIRRIVEDKTNDLIEVVAQMAEVNNVDASVIEKMREAITEHTPYSEKLKIAGMVLPDLNGINPLHELYRLVSKGIHSLTEDECLAITDQTKHVFEYIFSNLRAQTEDRKKFLEDVKGFSSNKKWT